MDTRFIIVCYDIPETKVRNRLVQLLFATGLSRIQYSVFYGVIPVGRISRMRSRMQAEFSDPENKILVTELCQSCISHLSCLHVDINTRARTFIVV
ncbi:MAG: CRISPR-associated endoribonuclease Cas2 1 [Methanoregulaceae archaeon PtaB.Bin009]|nr:MAG: CRISPR-associated endoribonuclease Cas2 1 [Methanoregulaceae archaeon PtaB.Bin009]